MYIRDNSIFLSGCGWGESIFRFCLSLYSCFNLIYQIVSLNTVTFDPNPEHKDLPALLPSWFAILLRAGGWYRPLQSPWAAASGPIQTVVLSLGQFVLSSLCNVISIFVLLSQVWTSKWNHAKGLYLRRRKSVVTCVSRVIFDISS